MVGWFGDWVVAPVAGDKISQANFLEIVAIELKTRGINEEQAADLRARLVTFAQDWDSPEMSIYDNPMAKERA